MGGEGLALGSKQGTSVSAPRQFDFEVPSVCRHRTRVRGALWL